MKKTGFTLAEVLITLGIVGVVSALVLPTFTTKMQTAKVGPRLAKAVAGFEQANIAILDDAQADALSGATLDNADVTSSSDHYLQDVLSRHMKGSFANNAFYSADGVSYCFVKTGALNKCDNIDMKFDKDYSNGNHLPHLTALGGNAHDAAVLIDIDGDNGPGHAGRDLFYFQMMDNGSLRPWGGSWEESGERWKDKCDEGQKITDSGADATRCAGHVMENGLKVEYK